MGLFKSIKHAVKKVTKAMTTSVVNTAKITSGLMNPVKETKELIKNPLKYVSGKVSDILGLEKLYSAPKQMTNAQTEEQQSASTTEELTSQDRARMANRQGFQGTNPTMLLGQGVDFEGLDLGRDEELGGR